jgi:site-specific recombinase XerD
VHALASSPKNERTILLVLPGPTALARDGSHFLLDRQVRGLSPHSVEYYSQGLRYLARFLDGLRVCRVEEVTADYPRSWLTFEARRTTTGGVRIVWRAAAAFLRWRKVENEPADWRNPVRKVKPPRVTLDPLPPVPLDDVRAMLRTRVGRTLEDMRAAAMLLALLDTGAGGREVVTFVGGDPQ